MSKQQSEAARSVTGCSPPASTVSSTSRATSVLRRDARHLRRSIARWDPDLIIATSWNETNQHVTDGELRPGARLNSSTRLAPRSTRPSTRWAPAVPTRCSCPCYLPDPQSPASTRRGQPRDVRSTDRDAAAGVPVQHDLRRPRSKRDDVLGVVDLTDEVCPDGACPLVVDDVVMRYDGGHFTATASRRLAPSSTTSSTRSASTSPPSTPPNHHHPPRRRHNQPLSHSASSTLRLRSPIAVTSRVPRIRVRA